MAEKITALLKVYYIFNDTKCLARGGCIAVTPIAPGADVATVDLRSCALAICSSSPELIGDKTMDYSIYTLDATEGSESDLYEGQGLLSWGLSQPTRLAKLVSGLIRPSLSGTFLEVRMKLSQVLQSSQQEFITSMQSFERISRTLPATFDYSNWNEFMKLTTGHTATAPNNAAKLPLRNLHNSTQVNTLQKARELAGRQNTQSMSAQLKTARQQQNSQQRHARLIAQQAAATQATIKQNSRPEPTHQRQTPTADGDLGGQSESATPPLPIPSSPPQMKTFPPPPAAVLRSSSFPNNDGLPPKPALMKLQSVGTLNNSGCQPESRGMKRKASELHSPGLPNGRSKDYSPTKAIIAAKNNIETIQQLFNKAKSVGGASPGPTILDRLQQIRTEAAVGELSIAVESLPSSNKNSRLAEIESVPLPKSNLEVIKAPEDGQQVKYCFNCGTIETRGNWRQFEVDGRKNTLCNACGVYYKTKNKMRPEKLWDRNKVFNLSNKADHLGAFPARSGSGAGESGINHSTPFSSEADLGGGLNQVAQTSPLKPIEYQVRNARSRATKSSPVMAGAAIHGSRSIHRLDRPTGQKDAENICPRTPTRETLHELHTNTTPPGLPCPSPASGSNNVQDLWALLRTPKSAGKLFSSPSPWRKMFTLLDQAPRNALDSPSKQRSSHALDNMNLLDEANFEFDAMANFEFSPLPNAGENVHTYSSAMTSSPGLGIFTSSAVLENNDDTPEDISVPPVSTPTKSSAAHQDQLEYGASLFTPKTPKTRARTGKMHETVRRMGHDQDGGQSMFGGHL